MLREDYNTSYAALLQENRTFVHLHVIYKDPGVVYRKNEVYYRKLTDLFQKGSNRKQ